MSLERAMTMSTRPRTPRKNVALHEAGHAIVAYLLGKQVEEVTIESDGSLQGLTRYSPEPNEATYLAQARTECEHGGFVNSDARRWIEATVMTALAGGIAQEVNKKSAKARKAALAGCKGDQERVWHLVHEANWGPAEASAHQRWLEQRTRNLLQPSGWEWAAVEAVAEALLIDGALDGKRLAAIVESKRPP